MIAQPQPAAVSILAAVSAACNLVSESGLVIPKGTPGRILAWTPTGGIVIDFGLMPVFVVPANSPLIKVG